MNRREKKHIRLQISQLLDTHCALCDERNDGKDSKCLTTCPIGKRMQALSSQLEQHETHTNPNVEPPSKKGRWTAEEELYLWNHRQILSISQLAARLERDRNAVYLKLRQLIKKGGISNSRKEDVKHPL
jgi:Zinc-finger